MGRTLHLRVVQKCPHGIGQVPRCQFVAVRGGQQGVVISRRTRLKMGYVPPHPGHQSAGCLLPQALGRVSCIWSAATLRVLPCGTRTELPLSPRTSAGASHCRLSSIRLCAVQKRLGTCHLYESAKLRDWRRKRAVRDSRRGRAQRSSGLGWSLPPPLRSAREALPPARAVGVRRC